MKAFKGNFRDDYGQVYGDIQTPNTVKQQIFAF